jgi:superfamily I DNA and/or RNA helicase
MEAGIVIIACVRSNRVGRIGFLNHPNRLNVAISRAQHRLIIVGNKRTFLAPSRRKEHKNPLWAHLVAAIGEAR